MNVVCEWPLLNNVKSFVVFNIFRTLEVNEASKFWEINSFLKPTNFSKHFYIDKPAPHEWRSVGQRGFCGGDTTSKVVVWNSKIPKKLS